MPSIEIEEFNASTATKWFVDQPVENKQEEAYEILVKVSRNDDHTRKNLSDFL